MGTIDTNLERDDFAFSQGDDPSQWDLPIHDSEAVAQSVMAFKNGNHTVPAVHHAAVVNNLRQAVNTRASAQDKNRLLAYLNEVDRAGAGQQHDVDEAGPGLASPKAKTEEI